MAAEAQDVEVYDIKGTGELPEKVPGKHRWVIFASHVVSDVQAAMIYGQVKYGRKLEPPVLLNDTNRFGVEGPGCVDCQLTYYLAHKRPCPARAIDSKRGK